MVKEKAISKIEPLHRRIAEFKRLKKGCYKTRVAAEYRLCIRMKPGGYHAATVENCPFYDFCRGYWYEFFPSKNKSKTI